MRNDKRNIYMRRLALALLPALFLQGCSLARQELQETARKQEKLCGVLVTVGDSGKRLKEEENLEGKVFSSIQELEEALAAPLTVEAEGIPGEDRIYTFEGVEGHFLGIFEEEDQAGSYVHFANDGSFGEVKAETKVTDTETLNRLEAVVMVDLGLQEPVYLNPVYQRGDGTVYAELSGSGYLLGGALGGGEVYGTTYSSRETKEYQGKAETDARELSLALKAGLPVKTLRILEMDGENRLLGIQEISREMGEVPLRRETAYVIVEEERRDGSLKRSLYDVEQGTGNQESIVHKVYYPGEDGILVPEELNIGGH